MNINKNSLGYRINTIAKKKEISQNVLYARYFFDCFLMRLSKSKYNEKFILKGGLYLSSALGIDNRSTIDMDFLVYKLKMEHNIIINCIKEICNMPFEDNVTFTYIDDSTIMKDDTYGGISVKIEGKIENIKQIFDIDLATGDVIYPYEVKYDYECIITKEKIKLTCYSLESVISEKLQTFLSRNILNSRSKDLYDLYVLIKLKIDDEFIKGLRIAFGKTCEYRKTNLTKEEAINVFNMIKENKIQKKRWEAYTQKVKYAEGIPYNDVMNSIENLILQIYQ